MNFFKSLISDDPDPPNPENPPQDAEHEKDHDHNDPVVDNADSSGADGGNVWGFGGLIQTLTARSESVLETYRRDLREFGSGLRKETELFREVAGRAVKELPSSIEVAHGAIDGVIKSTAEIISHSKETILAQSADHGAPPETPERSLSSGRYSWFESQLTAVQNDVNTFCEDPEDLEEFSKWKSGFSLTERSEEIESLIGENGALEGMYKRVVVPNEVDRETFWCRYFYRVQKLKQQESVRAKLVKRAIDDEEEELSWDFDDDEDDDSSYELKTNNLKPKGDETKELGDRSVNKDEEQRSDQHLSVAQESGENKSIDLNSKGDISDKKELGEGNSIKNVSDESLQNAGIAKESGENENDVVTVGKGDVVLSDEGASDTPDHLKESSGVSSEAQKVGLQQSSQVENVEKAVKLEGKSDGGGSTKDNDTPSLSSQKPVLEEEVEEEEEDLSWDEIEDSESNDEKKVSKPSGSANRADVRKRLSTAEEDEDLSWDIEDDD